MSINLTDEIEVKTKKGKLCAAKQIFLEGDIQTVEKEIQDINSRHNILNTKHESLSRTVQGIAATGGASTATNVTYNNDASGLNAENAQNAIDELQGSKFDKTSILQKSGTALDKVMSQGAVKTELDKKFDSSNVIQTFGTSESKVMSTNAIANSFYKIKTYYIGGNIDETDNSALSSALLTVPENTRAIPALCMFKNNQGVTRLLLCRSAAISTNGPGGPTVTDEIWGNLTNWYMQANTLDTSKLNNKIDKKFDSSNVIQTFGTSESKVMSTNAIANSFYKIKTYYIGGNIDETDNSALSSALLTVPENTRAIPALCMFKNNQGVTRLLLCRSAAISTNGPGGPTVTDEIWGNLTNWYMQANTLDTSKLNNEIDKIKKEISSSKNYELIIFMGQSNMAGRGIVNNEHPENAPTCNTGYEFRAYSDPTRLYPITKTFGLTENNPNGIDDGNLKTGSLVPSFINAYTSITNTLIIGVSASKGGSTISQWQPNTSLLNDAINRIDTAIAYVKSKYNIHKASIVWLQGESDGDRNLSKEDYKVYFKTMLSELFKHNIDRCYLIRIGQYNGNQNINYSKIIEAQTELCKENDNIIMVSTALSSFKDKGLMKDEFHYYQDGYNKIGTLSGYNAAIFSKYKHERQQYDSTINDFYKSEKCY